MVSLARIISNYGAIQQNGSLEYTIKTLCWRRCSVFSSKAKITLKIIIIRSYHAQCASHAFKSNAVGQMWTSSVSWLLSMWLPELFVVSKKDKRAKVAHSQQAIHSVRVEWCDHICFTLNKIICHRFLFNAIICVYKFFISVSFECVRARARPFWKSNWVHRIAFDVGSF